MRKSLYYIKDIPFELEIQGDTCFGDEKILLREDDDLTKNTDWCNQGYTVEKFLEDTIFEILVMRLTAFVKSTIESIIHQKIAVFSLDRYHDYCQNDDVHLAVIRTLQLKSPLVNFPIADNILNQRLSALCKLPVSCNDLSNYASGRFFLRIIRPKKYQDNNPPHRDVWLDHLRNAINIYVPLAGSNQLSSLPIIPSSHLWREKDMERTTSGAVVNGITYNVSTIVASSYGLNMIRPKVEKNEMMVFSPYLIHGGGINLNEDSTRVSLEMRFWRV